MHPPTDTTRPGVMTCVVGLVLLTLGACDSGGGGEAAAPLAVLATIGGTGLSPGQFVYPRAIDAGEHVLWVVDKSARVQAFSLEDDSYVGGFQMPRSELGKPTGITVAPGPDGREALYVADTHYHRVMIYDATRPEAAEPTLLASFGEYGQGPGQFVYPTDVFVLVGEDGLPERLYVSEYGGNDRISVFDPSYHFLFSFGAPPDHEGPVHFDRPQSVDYDASIDELIVTDAIEHRIGRFTLDGELIGWIGSPDAAGPAPGSFAYPYGLALPGNGTALISEFGNSRVQHIDLRTGEVLGVYGVPGREEGELLNPWGLVIVGDRVWVLSSGSDRAVSFAAPRRAREVTSR